MNLYGYDFSEPIPIEASGLINKAAVYIVMTHDNAKWIYLYIGQTGDLEERFDKHEKWNCWQRYKKNGGLFFSFLLESNKDQRLEIELALKLFLRKSGNLPCNLQ